ncbi:MAG TPA: outer membrane protein assembly factor BamC [Burkholderiaceae bacterium]|nr:outer membrane protein assembly factor BamC [Burkholderiaceae bacterium]
MAGTLTFARRSGLAAITFVLLLGPTLSGCSWLHFGSDEEAYDYRKAKPRQEPLEVPPDLSQLPKDDRYALPTASAAAKATANANAANASAANASAASAPAPSVAATEAGGTGAPPQVAPAGVNVAPTVAGARIVRDGNQRWLAVDLSPEIAYATIKDLWTSLGYKIAVDEPRLGVLETDWAETHPVIEQDALRNVLHKVFGSYDANGERNKYRARIERTEKNTAEITISHRAMEEVFTSPLHENTKWQAVPPRPELEAEMLQRVALRFASAAPLQVAVAPSSSAASASAVAPTSPASVPETSVSDSRVHKVTVGGMVTLQVEDSLDRTWRRVGIALDRGGFTVEERIRDKTTYAVRYLDPEYEAKEREKKSWWDRIFNADSKIPEQQFRIVMSANGPTTAVEVQDPDGKPDAGTTAVRILDQIMEQLR